MTIELKISLSCLLFVLALIIALPVAAQPRLLYNVNAAPGMDPGSEIELHSRLGDERLVFSAVSVEGGRDPWITDGTAGGTFRLADVAPGDLGAGVSPLGSSGGHAFFFVSRTGEVLEELWATDGTMQGTRRLLGGFDNRSIDSRPFADGSGRLFFFASAADGAPGLWVSDGSSAGTRRLGPPEAASSGGPFLEAVDGTVVFSSFSEIWGSDGTAAGTRLLPIGRDYFDLELALSVADGLLLGFRSFSEDDTEVWITDGSPGGTRREPALDPVAELGGAVSRGGRSWFWRTVDGVTRIWLREAGPPREIAQLAANQLIHKGVAIGDGLLVLVQQQTGGGDPRHEVWKLDRTGVVESGQRVVFPTFTSVEVLALGDAITWLELDRLWVSDGTPAGTSSVRFDFFPRFLGVRATPAGPRTLLIDQREIRNDPVDPGAGTADVLVFSDGTAQGTREVVAASQLVDVAPNPFDAPPDGSEFHATQGGVVFVADDRTRGAELWVSDGTAAGTGPLANLSMPTGDGDSDAHDLLRGGDGFVFAAHDGAGWGIWTSAGDEASTRRVARLPFQRLFSADRELRPALHAVVGSTLYATTGSTGWQRLQAIDLVSGEVRELAAFNLSLPEVASSAALVSVGSRVIFGNGDLLVASDGTVAGTDPQFARELFAVDNLGSTVLGSGLKSLDPGTVLFFARPPFDPPNIRRPYALWRTDGTLEGTRIVSDLGLDRDVSPPSPLVVASGLAYFTLLNERDDGSVNELWVSDGTSGGTRQVHETRRQGLDHRFVPLAAVDGGVYFANDFGLVELWISDGTPAGTRPLLSGARALRDVAQATPFAGGLLFAGEDAEHGSEPWVSDGTPAGTRRLADLWPGANGSAPRGFATTEGRAFFIAEDGLRRRFWTTDGTPQGTFAADGSEPPAEPVAQAEVLALADRAIYVADAPGTGEEPWLVPYAGLSPPAGGRPQGPSGLRATGTASIALDWVDRSANEQQFSVEVRTPETADFSELLRVPAATEAVVLDNLPFGVPHTFRVRAVNGFGASPPSNEVNVLPRAAPDDDCTPSADHLCLLGDRFLVRLFWRDPRSGDHGQANAVPLAGNDRSGTFWFFRPENVETIVKVLDGRGVNQRYWVFTGGLTDVERWLQVVDTANGDEQVYRQPAGELCGFGDTAAFAGGPSVARPATARTTAAAEAGDPLALFADRFEVSVDWRDPRSGDTGTGQPIPGGDNSGYFWFFNEQNVELVVKVLDGEPVNGNLWFFYGGLSDVEYTIRVHDLVNDVTKSYFHAPGDLCGGADTAAFAP